MLIIYRLLINITLILSPIILFLRLIKKKEDLNRCKEKLCFFSKKKKRGKLIWFHGASVGEIQSIVPLIEKLEKKKEIGQILITSNTLSSSKIINQFKFKKVTHQFFPIDVNFLSKKFLHYWNPSIAFFIDSEIWPNMILNLKNQKIPIVLINGRITKKSFNKWTNFPNFSNSLFKNFDLCLTSNNESKYYLKRLGAKKIKYIGNLKYAQSEYKLGNLKRSILNFMKLKKTWCASSTHPGEEKLCGLIHKKLKEKHKNLLTIIIPRHINRIDSILKDLKNLNLKIHLDEPLSSINPKTDVYLVNSYGKTKLFYSNCQNVFLGGSIINHGGQNPLEAARFGCNILHGKNVSNFKEIYKFLNRNKISQLVKSNIEFEKKLNNLLLKKINTSRKIRNKINFTGEKILKNTEKEINFYLKNAI